MATKLIFFTGGVISSVGKGVTAASVGRLLKARGFDITIQKLDPYLNVDPGTLSPYQHGEVFVLDDGSETDLDLGIMNAFVTSISKKPAQLRLVRSTKKSLIANAVGITLAAPSRSFRISPTRSNGGSTC